jgi:putative oxidoreductase
MINSEGKMNEQASATARAVTLNLLRIMTGFLFLPHGAQKLFGVLGRHAVPLISWLGLAGVLEFFGGLAIILGLFTRRVAFVLAGEMAVAYWWRHARSALLPIANGGELAVLYCSIFLLLWVHGGGRFSIDGLLHKS